MDHLLWGILIGGIAVLSLGGAGHALLFKRDPRSALGWIVVCITIPIAGPFFYWIMGVNRIRRKARQWLESGRRLAGWDQFPACFDRRAEQALPPGAEHLHELRTLSDRVVTAHLVSGNSLTPLFNGDNAYPAMLAAIAEATSSVYLSTYIFDADEVGKRFATALAAAAERGADVRLIIDSLGEKYSIPQARRLFKGSKVKVGRFLPLRHGGYVNLRNHRKILVVDGKIAFTGGMNISGRHMVTNPTTRAPVVDLNFKVIGPVVGNLQQIFLEDWFFVAGELENDPASFPELFPAGPALVRAVSDGPDKEFRKLLWIILGALSCARQTVRIMTPYFIPDRSLISALITAALRGVEISLVLPARNNLPYVQWASRSYLWELLQHGIRIYYQPPPFVHTKLFLVDDTWALIGSANLDPRSLRLNFELNLEVYDQAFTGELVRHFEEVIPISREETLENVDSRPLTEKIRDGMAKLFSPYL